MQEYKFFKGHESEMSALIRDKTKCDICGKVDRCFELDFTICNVFDDDEKDGKFGCEQCLRNGKFEFWHDTEVGMLDEKGLTHVYKHNQPVPKHFKEESLSELRRTPQFVTWQQELWLTHCDDFMMYLGEWKPKDFYENAKDGDGRKLFMEMTDVDLNHLWDSSLAKPKEKLENWHAAYYAFRCIHCDSLRGNWDCD